jgi:hypothetical protein
MGIQSEVASMSIGQEGHPGLPAPRRWGTVSKRVLLVVVLLSTASCRFSYDLNGGGNAPSWDQPPKSTDGSWRVALGEAILPLFFKDGTVYSPGFDETKFRSLPMGVDQSTVERELGAPISTKTFPGGNVCWYYSEAGEASENYFVRVLEFDSSRTLVARYASFYPGEW